MSILDIGKIKYVLSNITHDDYWRKNLTIGVLLLIWKSLAIITRLEIIIIQEWRYPGTGDLVLMVVRRFTGNISSNVWHSIDEVMLFH